MNSKKHTTIILKGETRQSANRFHDGVFRGNDDKTRKCYSIISSFFNNRYAFYFEINGNSRRAQLYHAFSFKDDHINCAQQQEKERPLDA